MSHPSLNQKKIVIIDTQVPHEQNNKFFDPASIRDNRFLWPWCYLYEECRKQGIQLVTSDIFLSLPNPPPGAIFISVHTASQATNRLMRAGARPAVIFGYENPLYACRFYFNLKSYTRNYGHAFVWRGAKDRLPPGVIFHDAAYRPHAYTQSESIRSNFSQKKFLAIVSRNHRLHKLRKLYVWTMNRIRPLPTLLERDLYLDRLEALDYFSKNSEIDLYGAGWTKPVKYTGGHFSASIQKSYRGYVRDKLATLRNYKFCLCFENVVFGGLVSEKIIDCLFAGCLPIYFGAPDITDYIPSNVFIDLRNFKDYQELNIYLKNMNEKTYGQYLENINRFTRSKEGYNFTQEKFARDLIKTFKSYF